MGFAEKLNNLLAGRGFKEDQVIRKREQSNKKLTAKQKKKLAEDDFWRGEDDMPLITKMAMLNNDMDGDGIPDNDNPASFDQDADGIPDEFDTVYNDDNE